MTEQDQMKQYGQLIAKAWSDPAFKEQMLADPAGTLRAQGFAVSAGTHVRVLEPSEARIFVPLPARVPVAEQPDEWVELWRRAYNEPAFKARLLAEPEATLAEVGIPVPAGVTVEVVEASDTQGYVVLPPTPEELDVDSLDDDVAGYFTCSVWGDGGGGDPHPGTGTFTRRETITIGGAAPARLFHFP